MNPQFTNNRAPLPNNNIFYNPHKDNNTNNTVFLNQNSQFNPFSPNNINSKGFIAKSNIIEGKVNNSTTNFVKNNNDVQVPINKLNNNSMTSPTYHNNSYTSFGQLNKHSSEMVKSNIQQQIKGNDNPVISTPSRRAPRMSETNQLDPPGFKQFQNKTQSQTTTQTFQSKKNIKQPENTFFRNKNPLNNDPEEKIKPFIPRPQFLNKSIGKKKTISTSNFRKIKQLGSGKYGQVSLVQQISSGFICALKMIEKKLLKEEDIIEQFIRELKIQTFLNHPNIIKMYGFFDDQNYIYIILEVGTGGQLFHQLRKTDPMPQAKVAPIIKQVCDAVNEIHSLHIIHRDIKPQNIVLHDNVIKLCDFGWSVYQDNKLRTTFCGTPLYVCPQILKGKQYDQKIDIWSLGIMMYEMLVGQNPFKITREQQLIKIVKDQISIPSYVFVSREARDFLDKCLRKNPDDRVNIKELVNHEFLLKDHEKNNKQVIF